MPDSDGQSRPRHDYYSERELTNRGWTEEHVQKYLGMPDIYGVNPYYPKGPPLCFYLKERVHKAESRRDSPEEESPSGNYVFDREQIAMLLDEALDIFMEFQYKRGFEEPKARTATVLEIFRRLDEDNRP